MDREPTLFQAMAALVRRRLETERCGHRVVTATKIDCPDCIEELIAENLRTIAMAATNGQTP